MERRARRTRGPFAAVALAITGLLVVATTPTAAAAAGPVRGPAATAGSDGGALSTDPPPSPNAPARGPRIINGSESPNGQWPWIASLQYTSGGHFCGGSLVAATWVVTAAHCVTSEQTGRPDIVPADLRIRLGSNSTSAGGVLHRAARIIVHPQYSHTTIRNDIAVIQLQTPSAQTTITMSADAGDDAALASPGTQLWAAGWGNTDPNGANQAGVYPDRVRHSDLYVQSDDVCAQTTDGYTASVICGWKSNAGICQGDSGGPLMAYEESRGQWFLIGLSSYNLRYGPGNIHNCANPNAATAFSRVSFFDGWVEDHAEAGPHRSEDAMIRQVHRDFIGREATAAEMNRWRSYLATDKWTSDMVGEFTRSATWESQARSSVRLYRAAFLRDPDTSGLTYWVNQRKVGRSLTWQANFFANSAEFRSRYGSLTNGQFVSRVYQNVLGRAPDPSGYDFWLTRIDTGTTRGRMLAEFSQTGEHRRLTDARVDAVAMVFAMLRRVPTTAELGWAISQHRRTVAWWLIGSYAYGRRFA